MGRLLASLGVVLLCACLVAPAGAGSGPFREATTAQQFDHTEFRITVYGNGSAKWTFRYGKTLTNDSERQQFRAFADQFENGTSPLFEDFRTRARRLAAEGANVTGRNMTARRFRKRAYVEGLDEGLGVVEMSFTWTAFARVDGREVRIGDVFEGGLYIGPGQRLVVEAGDGLSFRSADPAPDDLAGSTLSESDSLTWQGERRFTDRHPQVALSRPQTTATTGDTTRAGTGGDGSPGTSSLAVTATTDPGSTLSTVPWLVVTAFAAAVVVGAVVLLQRAGIAFDGDETGGTTPGGVPGDGPGPGEPAVPEEEMLTDEERVLGLLRENGGRMRQVNIVEETGWSKSKVSMLLSEMEDDDQITKLRVGRENIVSLPGHEPDASDSALE